MPKFRVSGTFQRDFVVEVEADDADEACDIAEQMGLGDFDSTSYVETRVDDCLELDENGEEIVSPPSGAAYLLLLTFSDLTDQEVRVAIHDFAGQGGLADLVRAAREYRSDPRIGSQMNRLKRIMMEDM